MILISGSNGNVGAVLVRQLMEENEVKAMVHYNSYNLPENVKFVRADIRFRDEVDEAMNGCDAVIHLAAQIHVDISRRYPELFYETNVRGTMNVLEAARRYDASVIYISSCETLGHIPEGGADETWPYRWPMSPYAASKLAAEQYCLSYHQTYGMKINVARSFNLVGPYQHPGDRGALIPKFIQMVLRGETPNIYGNGEQIRDYLDVRDFCRGLETLLHSLHTGEVFHFCSGRGITVNQVVCLILQEMKSTVKPIYVENRPGELIRSVGNNEKAKKFLDWEPEIPLKQSILDIKDHIQRTQSLGAPPISGTRQGDSNDG